MGLFRLKFVLLFVFAMFLSQVAMGGLMVDPYLGYRTGGYDFTYTDAGTPYDFEYDANGYGYGLRLGYQHLGFMGGAVYGLGAVESEMSSAPSGIALETEKDEHDTTEIGVFVGYAGLPFIRFWGTYYFNYEWEISKTNAATNSTKGELFTGNGFGLGVGYTGLPFVSFNLEYKKCTFDEAKDADGTKTSFPTDTYSEFDVHEIVISVSAPFDFPLF